MAVAIQARHGERMDGDMMFVKLSDDHANAQCTYDLIIVVSGFSCILGMLAGFKRGLTVIMVLCIPTVASPDT